jgi:hypothetical protein
MNNTKKFVHKKFKKKIEIIFLLQKIYLFSFKLNLNSKKKRKRKKHQNSLNNK